MWENATVSGAKQEQEGTYQLTPDQNVMAATYPEMFNAAIVYSGTAAGCFYSQSGGTNAWNNSCANGQARGTPQVWAKVSSIS